MIKVYLSHHIRGPEGENSTPASREANKQAARFMAMLLRKMYPELDIYVPAEHDQVVEYLYTKGYVNARQIIEADCVIISDCKFVIVYNQYSKVSEGMHIEIDHCMYSQIPFIVVNGDGLDEKANDDIRGLISFFEKESKDE